MRKTAATAVTLFLLGACGGDAAGSEAFCEATREAITQNVTDEVPPELDTMVEEAPEEIADAAETVRDGFAEAVENQDPAALTSEDFTAAAEELAKYADENCEGVQEE